MAEPATLRRQVLGSSPRGLTHADRERPTVHRRSLRCSRSVTPNRGYWTMSCPNLHGWGLHAKDYVPAKGTETDEPGVMSPVSHAWWLSVACGPRSPLSARVSVVPTGTCMLDGRSCTRWSRLCPLARGHRYARFLPPGRQGSGLPRPTLPCQPPGLLLRPGRWVALSANAHTASPSVVVTPPRLPPAATATYCVALTEYVIGGALIPQPTWTATGQRMSVRNMRSESHRPGP